MMNENQDIYVVTGASAPRENLKRMRKNKMGDQKKPLVNYPTIHQIGFIVKDAVKAAKYYADNFGWGSWEFTDAEFRNYTFRGKIYDYAKQKIAFALHGPLNIELTEISDRKAYTYCLSCHDRDLSCPLRSGEMRKGF